MFACDWTRPCICKPDWEWVDGQQSDGVASEAGQAHDEVENASLELVTPLSGCRVGYQPLNYCLPPITYLP